MKTLRISIILLLLGKLGVSALSIDDQVSAIVSATPEERVILVNEFKQTLSEMSIEDRTAAITLMRSNMSATKTQLKTETKIRARVDQTTPTQDVQTAQQMHQHQTASQAMQQGQIGSGSISQPTIGTGTPNQFMGKK